MFSTIKKWLLVLLLLSVSGFLLYQGYLFRLQRDLLPVGTRIGEIDVSGLTIEQARDEIIASYYSPVFLYHQENHVELRPQDVGFTLGLDSMLSEVQSQMAGRDERVGYFSFLLGQPLEPIEVPLMATHDRLSLRAMIQSIAGFLDEPAQPAKMLSQEVALNEGKAGITTDVEASMPAAEDALYRLDNRMARLSLVEEEPPEMNMKLLEEAILAKLHSFNGMGSIFVLDLQTGEEVNINADVAMSGLSILKIAIFVEAFRALDDAPNAEQQALFLDTATRSSNYGANLLLHIVAGEDNTYRGADILTESMHKLGLMNTFIAVPYDASPPAYRQTTYVTPANSRTDVTSQPDATMQSTAEEIGTLLAMIYNCSKGGGALLALYPEEITAKECQDIIDLMILNEEGNLIRFGVPQGTPVSHKHGWALGTHADAGIVLSPGGDFVIVEYLNQPGSWLVADESFPILREIARATYNYFNMDDPHMVELASDFEEIDPSNPFAEDLGDVESGADLQDSAVEETGANVNPSPTPTVGEDAS